MKTYTTLRDTIRNLCIRISLFQKFELSLSTFCISNCDVGSDVSNSNFESSDLNLRVTTRLYRFGTRYNQLPWSVLAFGLVKLSKPTQIIGRSHFLSMLLFFLISRLPQPWQRAPTERSTSAQKLSSSWSHWTRWRWSRGSTTRSSPWRSSLSRSSLLYGRFQQRLGCWWIFFLSKEVNVTEWWATVTYGKLIFSE